MIAVFANANDPRKRLGYTDEVWEAVMAQCPELLICLWGAYRLEHAQRMKIEDPIGVEALQYIARFIKDVAEQKHDIPFMMSDLVHAMHAAVRLKMEQGQENVSPRSITLIQKIQDVLRQIVVDIWEGHDTPIYELGYHIRHTANAS